MTRKYPLDPLRRVREEKVDRQVRALADSLLGVEEARRETQRAETRQRAHEDAVARTFAEERELLARGTLTAADLARGAAWKVAADIDGRARAKATEEARASQRAAEQGAARQRAQLAEAKTAAELVTKHHDAWRRAGEVAALARDEEDAEQAYLGVASRRGAS